jgi:hypothetical protein
MSPKSLGVEVHGDVSVRLNEGVLLENLVVREIPVVFDTAGSGELAIPRRPRRERLSWGGGRA